MTTDTFPALGARVLSTRALPCSDDFGTTLLTDMGVLWIRLSRWMRVGSLLHLTDVVAEQRKERVYHVHSAARVELVDTPRKRFVPDEVLQACDQVCSLPLFPHQREGAGWLAARLMQGKGSIVGDDPGLGKTLMTLVGATAAGKIPLIVCCPSSVKSNWHQEATRLRLHLHVEMLNGRRGPLPTAHIIVINYDLLRARERQLKRCGARLIVFDEAHMLKEPQVGSTHRAAVATRIAHEIGLTLCLTGTPVSNRPAELWRLMHLVDPQHWPSFTAFHKRFLATPPSDEVVDSLVTPRGRVFRVHELRSGLDEVMIRRQKKDVLSGLPEKKVLTTTISLPEPVMVTYRQAEGDVVRWLHSLGAAKRARAATRGKAMVKINWLRKIVMLAKIRCAYQKWLQHFLQRHPRESLVVFGYHVEGIRRMAKITRGLGVTYGRLKGNDSSDRRIQLIEGFQDGQFQVFLVPLRAAGLGLNLQRARFGLFLERTWTPTEMRQAEDRIHRLGQTLPVEICYLDAANTVDVDIRAVLAAKQRLIGGIIDDEEIVVSEKQLFADLLHHLVQSRSA